MQKSKITYEEEDDILNIWLSEKPYAFAEMSGNVVVHYAENNEPVYIEVLFAKKFLKDLDKSLPKKVKKEIFSEIQPVVSSVQHRIK